MITGFEDETAPLSEKEMALAYKIADYLRSHARGKLKAKKAPTILRAVGQRADSNSPRLRKIINYMRRKSMIHGLIATSKGYYIATEKAEVLKCVKSLMERAKAIKFVADCLQRDCDNVKENKQGDLFE